MILHVGSSIVIPVEHLAIRDEISGLDDTIL